jgi:four helix bundle protein
VGKKGFKDLLVWQLAKDLAVRVYCVSESQNLKKDFGLCDQIRRSAVSVASNLAEGDERSSDRDSVRFFYMAKGSVAEVRTQIQIACEVGHLRKPEYDSLEAEYEQLAKKIGSLIRARSQASSR